MSSDIESARLGTAPAEGPQNDPMLKVISRSRWPLMKPEEKENTENIPARYPVTSYAGYTVICKYEKGVNGGTLEVYDSAGALENSWHFDAEMNEPEFYVKNDNVLALNLNSGDNVMLTLEGIVSQGRVLPVRNWSNYSTIYPQKQLSVLAEVDDGSAALVHCHLSFTNVIKVVQKLASYNSGHDRYSEDLAGGVGDNFCCESDNIPASHTAWSGNQYYCVARKPIKIAKLSISTADISSRHVDVAKSEVLIEKEYESVHALRHWAEAGIFTLETDGNLTFIDDTTGEELHLINGFSHIHYANGKIKGLDNDGRLIIADIAFEHIAELRAAKQQEKVLRGLAIVDLAASSRERARVALLQKVGVVVEAKRAETDALFEPLLRGLTDIASVGIAEEKVSLFKAGLLIKGVALPDAEAVVANVEAALLARKREITEHETQARLGEIEAALKRGVTLANLGSVQNTIAVLRSHSSVLIPAQIAKLDQYAGELDIATIDLYNREKEVIASDLHEFEARLEASLAAINGNKVSFDRWYANEWPKEKSKVRALLNTCPFGANEAYELIKNTIATTDTLVAARHDQFEKQYEAVREVAVKRQDELVGLIESDIDHFIVQLDRQHFVDSAQAQAWVTTQASYGLIMESLRALHLKDSQRSNELEHELLSRVGSALDRKKRMEHTTVTDEGVRTIRLGDEEFPIWERTVSAKDKPSVSVGIVFQPEPGQGAVKASDRLGKVMINATTAGRSSALVDLWHDQGADADTIRLGLASYRGKEIPPSVMTGTQYKEFQKHAIDWNKGEQSLLRKKDVELNVGLRQTYKQRKTDPNWNHPNAEWRLQYKKLLDEYAAFCEEHHIVLLSQMDRVSHQLAAGEAAQSIGAVPRWSSHWVMDGETEKMLAEVARAAKMELHLQEGVINLKGHAGTGKDVLVKMLCHLSNRPYFAFDCTKWTTEYELAEDVQLVAQDGVTTTIRVPSSVLLALQTPGAVLYFNEFNAMPEQSQIYLHALFDEKRTMTIKTRSGESIKADPSVLFISSMNPGYEGTYEPQIATKSRTIPIEVSYPALMNPDGKTYSSSEAWRIARGVDSLFRLTLQGDATDNAFVRAWNVEVNRLVVANSVVLTPVQEFDLKVVTALVQFGNKLRGAFIQQYEKGTRTPGAAKGIKVVQPLTGREMRRFAYRLNQIPPAKKVGLDPEAVARDLITTLFLVHIDNSADRAEAKKAMDNWSIAKAS